MGVVYFVKRDDQFRMYSHATLHLRSLPLEKVLIVILDNERLWRSHSFFGGVGSFSADDIFPPLHLHHTKWNHYFLKCILGWYSPSSLSDSRCKSHSRLAQCYHPNQGTVSTRASNERSKLVAHVLVFNKVKSDENITEKNKKHIESVTTFCYFNL